MKKFFIILCVILMAIPMCTLAEGKSPTLRNVSYSTPSVQFEIVDNAITIYNIEKMFPEEELEGYLWQELLYVKLDKEYDIIKWHLLMDLSKVEKVRAVIIGIDGAVTVQDCIIENNLIVTDFTGFPPGDYFIAFFTEKIV